MGWWAQTIFAIIGTWLGLIALFILVYSLVVTIFWLKKIVTPQWGREHSELYVWTKWRVSRGLEKMSESRFSIFFSVSWNLAWGLFFFGAFWFLRAVFFGIPAALRYRPVFGKRSEAKVVAFPKDRWVESGGAGRPPQDAA